MSKLVASTLNPVMLATKQNEADGHTGLDIIQTLLAPLFGMMLRPSGPAQMLRNRVYKTRFTR